MAFKLNNMNKATVFVTLLGLLLGVLARSCVQGLQKNEGEENGSYFGQQFDELCNNVCTSIQNGLVTLTVKFLHFFISSCLQFRYLPALFPAPWTMSMSFWVAFTRSISSMPNNPLQ
ncbi:hypothetical protein QUC31_000561 [Theobroma cacao]|uniref:Uncharacterized protein LOC18591818 n=2 Tax=Theobroma cacao TaxID=3641 RepID=A0AB32UV32_THECC|nr:PREDICTED: uncharacterized protein LOC18591818 [Theobroma cacao]EOY15472.1 Uncharacterized protein TCM_034523 [Theobroma cacao]WRX30745.1 hypothetical protein QQP08_023232 [Theobroma cacao]